MGAALGIVRAIGRELAARCARVVACDIVNAGLAEALAMLGKEGLAYVCDVSDYARAEVLAAYAGAPLDGCKSGTGKFSFSILSSFTNARSLCPLNLCA